MEFECKVCGRKYDNRKALKKHIRVRHPNKVLKFNYCGYVVSTSLKYRMEEHMKSRHSHVSGKSTGFMEVTIPATPYLGIDKDETEKIRKREDTSDKRKSSSSNSDRSQHRRERKTEGKREHKPSKRTPEKTSTYSNLSSPVSIILGYNDHDVSPIKKDLLGLFDSPIKIVSSLQSSPKKLRMDECTESRTGGLIIIEDETLNAAYNTCEETYTSVKEKPMIPTVSRKRDSSHLALPKKDVVEEGKKWNRFLAPPSLFQETEDAKRVKEVRDKAKKHDNDTASVIPVGYSGVMKEEKVIFPDGTVYYLSAFWMPNPQCKQRKKKKTQTLKISNADKSSGTDSTDAKTVETQTVQLEVTRKVEIASTTQWTQTDSNRNDIRLVVLSGDDEGQEFCSYIS